MHFIPPHEVQCFVIGTNTSCAYFHGNSTNLSRVSLGDKVVLDDIYSLPTDAGGDDWYKKSSRLILHKKGNENS